jgi:hypothetical protein
MTGKDPRKPRGTTLVAVGAVVAVAYAVTRPERDAGANVPPGAAGWHGAMELYRTLALWAGKRALAAEMHYWEAVGR